MIVMVIMIIMIIMIIMLTVIIAITRPSPPTRRAGSGRPRSASSRAWPRAGWRITTTTTTTTITIFCCYHVYVYSLLPLRAHGLGPAGGTRVQLL